MYTVDKSLEIPLAGFGVAEIGKIQPRQPKGGDLNRFKGW
jgi:hypothetical protein